MVQIECLSTFTVLGPKNCFVIQLRGVKLCQREFLMTYFASELYKGLGPSKGHDYGCQVMVPQVFLVICFFAALKIIRLMIRAFDTVLLSRVNDIISGDIAS